ncbi:MAG: electron transfer flavoprotein subunit alpha [Clostridiales bacterium]|nr:electron transfer flavoprotein subunit alpha [Clostridiales bacterium]
MSTLFFNKQKCNLCGKCVEACPFKALEEKAGAIEINAACKMCRICIKKCPEGAISLLDDARTKVDAAKWKGILVYVEHDEAGLHPVVLELLGEARKLADTVGHPVYALLTGEEGVRKYSQTLIEHGADRVFVYEHEELKGFRADCQANVFEDCINKVKPSVVLVGATSLGRSLAPRISTRFRTGLTADCTELQIKANTDLVQIRPAFGGNIMARIITPNARPQFATVRYKVMEKAEADCSRTGEEVLCAVTPEMVKSGIKILKTSVSEKHPGIEEAEVLVVGGRGFKTREDLNMLYELAELLGGKVAVTRPLIENGWANHKQQIGLSGRTVKPKLLMAFGVSGAIQWVAGMKSSECIIAINADKSAPIFNVANYCIEGDIYTILPMLIEKIKQGADLTEVCGLQAGGDRK